MRSLMTIRPIRGIPGYRFCAVEVMRRAADLAKWGAASRQAERARASDVAELSGSLAILKFAVQRAVEVVPLLGVQAAHAANVAPLI